MNLVLCFGAENSGKSDGVFDLAGWESLRMISAADGKAKLLTATRIVTEAGESADMKELVAVYEDDVAAGKDLYSIAVAIASRRPAVFLDWGQLPSDELMKRIGEATTTAADELPLPKRLIVRFDRGDASDAELRDLVGRRIADVKIAASAGGKSTADREAVVAVITEGPR